MLLQLQFNNGWWMVGVGYCCLSCHYESIYKKKMKEGTLLRLYSHYSYQYSLYSSVIKQPTSTL